MAITVGVDGYHSAAELVAYALEVGYTDLEALGATAIESLIKRATRELDQNYVYKGEIASEAQLLAWPRSGVEDREGRTIASDAYPPGLLIASYEMCEILRASGNPNSAITTGNVSKVKAGSVEVQFTGSNQASTAQKLRPVTLALAGLYSRAPGRRLPRNRPLLKA